MARNRGKNNTAILRLLIERDGLTCNGCGVECVRWEMNQPAGARYATVDHKVPDGGDHPDNLWILCSQCNSSKGRKSMEEWEKTLDFDTTIMRKGFTMVPNALLDNSDLSMGARMSLICLMSFAWRGDPFPGQERLAVMLGVTDRSVRGYLAELRDAEYLNVQRRGRGLTNVYRIITKKVMWAPPDRNETSEQDRKQVSALDRKQASTKEDEVEEHEGEEDKTLAAVPAASPYDPLKGTKLDGRNIPWDALVKVTHADEVAEKGRIAKALKTIREIVVRDSSEQTFLDAQNGEWWIARQITARAGLYRRRWPNVELTPMALATNWSRVMTEQPGSDPLATMDAAQRGIDAARRTA